MAGLNGQFVRLPNSSSVQIDTLQSGSLVSGVQLPGLGLNEQDFRNWSSTDISSTSLGVAGVVAEATHSGSVIEFNNGDLTVSEHQKILIKDSSGSYYFTPANTVDLNSDYLVKYTDSGIVEELITSAYEIQNQSIHTIAIEDIDVYLADGYIVHNPPGYSIYNCYTQAFLGSRFMTGEDPGSNPEQCWLVDGDEARQIGFGTCVYICADAESSDIGLFLSEPCDDSPGCSGDPDTSPGPQGLEGATGAGGSGGAPAATGPQGSQGSGGAAGNTGAQGASGISGADGAQGAGGISGAQGAQGSSGIFGAQGAQGAQGDGGHQGPSPQGAQGAQLEGGYLTWDDSNQKMEFYNTATSETYVIELYRSGSY